MDFGCWDSLKRIREKGLSSDQALATLSSHLLLPPILIHEPMANNKRSVSKTNKDVPPRNNVATTTYEPTDPDEVQQHVENLRNISAVAARLFTLLGEHINTLSSTAPIQRGHESVRLRSTPISLHSRLYSNCSFIVVGAHH